MTSPRDVIIGVIHNGPNSGCTGCGGEADRILKALSVAGYVFWERGPAHGQLHGDQGLGAQVAELTKLVNRLGERVDTAQVDTHDQSSQLVETERRMIEHTNGLHESVLKLTAEVGRAHSRLDKYMRGKTDDQPTD